MNNTPSNESPTDQDFDPKIRAQYSTEPDVIRASRQPETVSSGMSDKRKQLCDESRRNYPNLNLSEGEFVILDVKRHHIGLLPTILIAGFSLVALMAILILYPTGSGNEFASSLPSYGTILVPVILLMLIVIMAGYASVWVYLQNHFYMTNESVIQEIQTSLFSRHEQTVSLGSIEDASFKQTGIVQTMLDYGTVRLSTEGDETTYRFSHVARPREHVAKLNNAIESFKNGRAVDPYEN